MFEFSILEIVDDETVLDFKENIWINHYKANDREFGYNNKEFDEGYKSKTSEETKKKMSKARKGWSPSVEIRAKMRKAKLGVELSEEHKQNISKSNKGKGRKNWTDEERKNKSEKMKGIKLELSDEAIKKLSEKRKRKYLITKPDNSQEVILGLKEFCEKNGLNTKTMYNVASGFKPHCKGYKVTVLKQNNDFESTNKIISIDDYMNNCLDLAVYPSIGDNFEYVLFGLLGETGELANCWKKKIRDDFDLTEDRKNKLKDELSDVAWYFVMCCYELGLKPSEVLYRNIEKLTSRRERGVVKGDGDNR